MAVQGTAVVYDLASAQEATPSTLDFFDFPWPELSRPPSELANLPNPLEASDCSVSIPNELLAQLVGNIDPVEYRDYVANLAANFLTDAPNQAQIVMQFDGAVDTANLPSALGSLDATTSPVLLVNLEANGARGRLVPVLTRVLGNTRYAKPNTLSILPHPGFPMQPGALHAAVVLRKLNDAAGAPLGSPAGFEALKQRGECAPDAAYEAAFALIEAEYGISREQVAMMSVFRAGRPTAVLEQRIADVDAVTNPSVLGNVTVDGVTLDARGFYLISGEFENLIVQRGMPPYLPEITLNPVTQAATVSFDPESEAGMLLTSELPLTSGGADTSVARTERSYFKITVPQAVGTGALDPIGLPIVIYGPGTGGSIDTVTSNGMAEALAAHGIATFSTTPVMHQERAHSENIDPALMRLLRLSDALSGTDYEATMTQTVESGQLFFNPLDLQAAKGNSLQAAVDYAWQARLLSDLELTADLEDTSVVLSFAPHRLAFFGHSQGAATGPLLATSKHVAAQVLSAPSGHLITNLLGKTEPSDTLELSAMLDYLVCDDPAEPLDVHHPWLNLLLHWFEATDAANYAPLLTTEAPGQPRDVFALVGTEDHYVAPGSHDAVTTAARLQQLSPLLAPVPGQELLAELAPGAGYGATYATLSGNLWLGPSAATAAFRQYHGEGVTCDDHFVATCPANGDGWADWLYFLSGLGTGAPGVPAP